MMRGRLARLAPTLLFAACAIAALSPALASATRFADRYDWRYFDSMIEMSRRSIAWYHEAPLWNPYSCGGEVDLANPQSLSASPGFLLVLAFGTAVGIKLALCAHLFFAMDGSRRLARRLGISATGATLAGLAYGLSGYMALHFSEGHMTFVGVTLYPYLLLFYDRALDAAEWAIPCGLIAAWIVLLGGTFTPPMAAELLLLWATMEAVRRRSARPFAMLAAAGAVALAVAAVRMFPVLQFIHDHPRPPFMRKADASPPWQIAWDLIAWREFGPLDFGGYNATPILGGKLGPIVGHLFERQYWSHEYSARLPWALLPLWAGMFFWLAWSKRLPAPSRLSVRRLWAVALLGALFAMGNFASFAPWSLVQRLPVMRDLRVPSRHEILILLPLALLAGAGWDFVARAASARWPGRSIWVRRLGVALVLATAVDGALYSALTWRGIFASWLPSPSPPVPFYHDGSGDWLTMRQHLFQGHGSLGCDEEAPLQRAEALDPGEVAQERLLDPGAGTIVASAWSPNRRVITLDLRLPTVLMINSNWNEHWRTDQGAITKVAGRLAVDLAGLPPGRRVITLRYAPRSFDLGLSLTALSLPSLLCAFALAVRRRRGRPQGEPERDQGEGRLSK